MSAKELRQAYALAHPCYEAEETSNPKYGDIVAWPIVRILTVNSGFE